MGKMVLPVARLDVVLPPNSGTGSVQPPPPLDPKNMTKLTDFDIIMLLYNTPLPISRNG
jgi:hypothetical protein